MPSPVLFIQIKAHNEEFDCLIGDVVIIEETTPISKDKKWKVIKKLTDVKEVADETDNEEVPVEEEKKPALTESFGEAKEENKEEIDKEDN